jgi:hypothetical protein
MLRMSSIFSRWHNVERAYVHIAARLERTREALKLK